MQALFSAAARIVVRDLRKTETTDVIMVYSGTMHCVCAVIACIAMPGSLKILQHTWQVAMLLGTGMSSLVQMSRHNVHSVCSAVWIVHDLPAHIASCYAARNSLAQVSHHVCV